MSKKKQEEAAEQLHSDDDVDFEHIKDLMGPPPLEAPSSEIAVEQPVEPVDSEVKEPKEATTAPPLDTAELEEQFAQNLSVKNDEKVAVEVVPESEMAEELPLTKPTGKPEPDTGLISSEDFSEADLPIVARDDPELDKVIDDIVAKESDELLEAKDEKQAKFAKPKKAKLHTKLKNAWKWWWGNPKTRNLSIFLIVCGILAAGIAPASRYFLLNTFGVRASASIRVIDQNTTQPLKNVDVTLAGVSGKTDADGNVRLDHLKLGKTELVLKKRAFAEKRDQITVGWGSNPLDESSMVVTGTAYSLKLVDFFSGKPYEKIEVTSGEFSAVSDQDGKVSLAIDKVSDVDPEITIDNPGFRLEKFSPGDTAEQEIKLVPRKSHVFVSKRSGNYDLYKIDADGKNESVLLEATGKERDDLYIVPHPSDNVVAYVSTRDGQRNKDGYLLNSLYIIDVANAERTRVALTEAVQVVGWYGKKLLYVAITEGASANNPNRQKIFSYDQESEEKKELATANYFNDVLYANGSIYYAPSTALQTQNVEEGIYKIELSNGEKARLFDKEVWNAFRTEFDKLSLSVQQDWYELKLGEKSLTKVAGAPPVLRSREYAESPDSSNYLWVDERDGKGVLLRYDRESKKDETITERSGIRYPASWLGNRVLVYRVADGREVADYIVSLDGGEPTKLRDVTNTGSADHSGY